MWGPYERHVCRYVIEPAVKGVAGAVYKTMKRAFEGHLGCCMRDVEHV